MDSAHIAESSDILFTMLPNRPDVKNLLFEPEGIADRLRPGPVLIDMSSISPVVSRRISSRLEEKQVQMLDAPVSGGEPKAIDGTLAFMVGGKKEVFDQYSSLLSYMGSTVTYCGEIVAGNTTKLANQIIVAANIAAMSEAYTLAKKAGVSISTIYQAIRAGLAGSTVLDAETQKVLTGSYDPGFKIDLHIKDLTNVIETAQYTDTPIPITSQVFSILNALHDRGLGQADHSAIARYYKQESGISLKE